MVLYEVGHLGVEGGENVGIGGDESGLMAVASGEVLRGNNTDDFTRLGLDEEDFGVVVSEIGALHRLGDERPQFEGLVGGFVVENEVEGGDVARFLNEEESAQELLGDGERCLPHLGLADLGENPLQNVRHLKSVGEVGLVGTVGERL